MPHEQMIVLGIVLGVFVYLWSKKLFGLEAGIASLFIYCLDPTILAHSQLIHTDLMFTTFFFIGTYFFCQVRLRKLFGSDIQAHRERRIITELRLPYA